MATKKTLKEELIEELKKHLQPGESVLVERPKLQGLTARELCDVYHGTNGTLGEMLLAVVAADRRRLVERMREEWALLRPGGLFTQNDVINFLGVEVKP